MNSWNLGWLHGRPELDHGDRVAALIAAACDEADAYLSGTPGQTAD